MFQKLRTRGRLGSNFVGIVAYADDSFLLAPSRHALQDTLLICEKYAKEHNLQFSNFIWMLFTTRIPPQICVPESFEECTITLVNNSILLWMDFPLRKYLTWLTLSVSHDDSFSLPFFRGLVRKTVYWLNIWSSP